MIVASGADYRCSHEAFSDNIYSIVNRVIDITRVFPQGYKS